MARPSSAAAAALLLLLLSLLTVVAHCRPIEPQSATDDAEPGAAIVAAGGDDDGNGPPNPTLPAEEALPEQHGFLRLPSHRLRHHRPCRHGPFHRHHLWWARHHGAFGDAPSMRRFHFHHRHGEALRSHLPAALPFPAEEATEAGAEEVKAVAEPDPDRSLPDGETAAFADADGAHEAELAHDHEDDGAAVRAWKKEMLRRWFHFYHRHGMRLHRHHRDDEQEEEEDEAEGPKRFHHHHLHKEEEEKDTMMRKRFRRGEHDDGDDEEVEEMVRRFRKAIMRRRFGHGRRFHHHHHRHVNGHYRHAEEEAEKADAQEGGVVAWIKGLVNRF